MQTAVNNIEKIIKPALVGQSPFNIKNIDYAMIELDGTPNKSRLGANAVLAVSLANIYAGADYYKQYLFEYIQKYINYDLNLSGLGTRILCF